MYHRLFRRCVFIHRFGNSKFRIQKVHPLFPPTLKETVKDFILKMIHKGPKERLDDYRESVRDVGSHPFLRGINWNGKKSNKTKGTF